MIGCHCNVENLPLMVLTCTSMDFFISLYDEMASLDGTMFRMKTIFSLNSGWFARKCSKPVSR